MADSSDYSKQVDDIISGTCNQSADEMLRSGSSDEDSPT